MKHIINLFINFIYEHIPEIIDLGWLYVGVSPFYRVKVGKEFKYFNDNVDYNAFITKTIEEKYKLINKEINIAEIVDNYYLYINKFDLIRDDNSIQDEILSIITRCFSPEEALSIMKNDFGLKINKKTFNCEGMYNNEYNLFNVKEVFDLSRDLLNIFPNTEYLTIYNKSNDETEDYEIYEGIKILYKAFNYTRVRLKGLGESDSEELRVTSFDPATRSLIQVKSDKRFKDKEEDLLNILFENKAERRRKFIQEELFDKNSN